MVNNHKRVKEVPSYRINPFFITPPHPLGVKPSGNALLEDISFNAQKEARNKLLGSLSIFSEDLLVQIISYLDDPNDLLNFGLASRILYSYTYDEELWRKIYVDKFVSLGTSGKIDKELIYPFNSKTWRGSWRKTVLCIDYEASLNSDGLICSDLLYRPYQCSQIDYQQLFKKVIGFEKRSYELGYNRNPDFGIDRFEESEFTPAKFKNEYVDIPFILQNKTSSNRWPDWNLDFLVEEFSEETFSQEAITWKLSFYADYFKNNRDESPLYLFDCTSKAMEKISREYKPPELYKDDFFKLFQKYGADCRPDHRWLIVGPARSGSTFHKDPNYTSAWNTILSGMKLWVMFPSHIKPPGITTDKNEEEVTSPVGLAEWVLSGYYNDSVRLAQNGQCKIGMTFPGDCIYVPSGWWHLVINITDSVALTENFVPEPILPKVLDFFKNKRDQLSGFHLKEFINFIGVFINTQTDSIDEYDRLNTLKGFFQKYKDSDLGKTDVTCDQISFEIPAYELLVELIANSEYSNILNESIKKMNNIEQEELRKSLIGNKSNVKKSELWENLVKKSKESFSFDFTSNYE